MVKVDQRLLSAAMRIAVLSAATGCVFALSATPSEARTHHRHHHPHASRHTRPHHRHHLHALLPVSPNAPTSELVFDASSGRILALSNPEQQVYPASLTKMMTLYLAFRAIEQGWIAPDTIMQVSDYAATAAPTKLGLRAGQRIRVDDLMRGAVTESANDAARVLAENLDRDFGSSLKALMHADISALAATETSDASRSPGEISDDADEISALNALASGIRSDGTEADFAQIMTLQARLLGMDDTTFRNATGLPDADQVTTAPDMAKLAYAVVHLPAQYYAYFSLQRFNFAGISHHNHNLDFLSRYDGADGIKTGYTENGGFNVADSAQRNGQRLIAIVMGRRSHASRDADVRALLDTGFAELSDPPAAAADAQTYTLGGLLDLPALPDAQRQMPPEQSAETHPPSGAMGALADAGPADTLTLR